MNRARNEVVIDNDLVVCEALVAHGSPRSKSCTRQTRIA